MSRKTILIAVIVFGLTGSFNNCGGGTSQAANENASEVQKPAPQDLTASISPTTATLNQMTQVKAAGGSPPYIYTVVSGSGVVSIEGQAYGTAPSTVNIEVSDAEANKFYVSFSVVAGSAGTGSTCTTAWGATVPDGSQVSGFATDQVNCPNDCESVTMTCVNGKLTGITATASTCAVKTCVYYEDGKSDCPNAGYNDVQVTSLPTTCETNQYHTYTCYFDSKANIYNEYECGAPDEKIRLTDYSQQAH